MIPIIASCTKSWSHVVPLLPHLHEFSFQFPEQNMYWNIAPLWSARIFLSNEFSFVENWFRTRELCPFRPSAAICPDKFQNAQRSMFLPYLLVGVFKFIDLKCVGMGIWWSFWILTFCFLYSSEHVLKLMKTAASFSGFDDVDDLDWILLVLNSWERFFMPAKYFKHTLPPGWRSGVETNANIPIIPKIWICGIASLAKKNLKKPSECTCVLV